MHLQYGQDEQPAMGLHRTASGVGAYDDYGYAECLLGRQYGVSAQ